LQYKFANDIEPAAGLSPELQNAPGDLEPSKMIYSKRNWSGEALNWQSALGHNKSCKPPESGFVRLVSLFQVGECLNDRKEAASDILAAPTLSFEPKLDVRQAPS
jgi:hypothetical protein